MPAPFNVLLPIETINREIDFKLFLGAMYARPGRRIFVGQHDLLHNVLLPRLQGGVYVGKNLFMTHFPTSLARFQALKARGFNVVHLDEEGGIYQGNTPEHWKRMLDLRLDINSLSETDRVCAWGKFQEAHYASQRPEFADRITATGHPRFDLYKPRFREFFQPDIQRIKEKFGDFILINTNLTLANNVMGIEGTFSAFLGYVPDDPEKRLRFVEKWRHITHTHTNFVALIHRINATYPEINLVVRPHPSEDWNFYRKVFRGVPGIHVEHDGPVGAWIMAADALIHDGCTTAVEAYLAGKPVINYKSVVHPDFDYYLPNLLGVRCRTEDEVLEAVGRVSQGTFSKMEAEIPETATQLFHNFVSDDPFERVAEEMGKAEAELTVSPKTLSISQLQRIRLKQEVLGRAKSLVRPAFPEKLKAFRNYRNQFRGFTREETDRKMEKIQELLDKEVKYRFLGETLILIEG